MNYEYDVTKGDEIQEKHVLCNEHSLWLLQKGIHVGRDLTQIVSSNACVLCSETKPKEYFDKFKP